jgi:hypothetical protein
VSLLRVPQYAVEGVCYQLRRQDAGHGSGRWELMRVLESGAVERDAYVLLRGADDNLPEATRRLIGYTPEPLIHYLAHAGTLHQLSYTPCGEGYTDVVHTHDPKMTTCLDCRQALEAKEIRP